MNSLIFIFGSGWAFFISIGLLIATPFCAQCKSWLLNRLSGVFFLLGILIAAISSTPLPIWLWVGLGIACVAWLISSITQKFLNQALLLYFSIVAFALFHESQWHWLPALTPANEQTLVVVGDSVTAGTGANDKSNKWPNLIERDYGVRIDNRSVPGAKCSTALKQLQAEPVLSPNIFLAIGGNDLLGSTSNEKFEHDLEHLLCYICRPGRQVIMFELPLPPLRNRYGMIQRRLAGKYGVQLVPKRLFVAVLTAENSTIDSVHLTQVGHERMAKTVWQSIHPIFGK